MSVVMFSLMFHWLMWTNFFYWILACRASHGFLSRLLFATLGFSNFVDFRQPQIPNARTKYYEILTTNTDNITNNIANLYIVSKYHLSTLQKIPITFEQGRSEATCYYQRNIRQDKQIIPKNKQLLRIHIDYTNCVILWWRVFLFFCRSAAAQIECFDGCRPRKRSRSEEYHEMITEMLDLIHEIGICLDVDW